MSRYYSNLAEATQGIKQKDWTNSESAIDRQKDRCEQVFTAVVEAQCNSPVLIPKKFKMLDIPKCGSTWESHDYHGVYKWNQRERRYDGRDPFIKAYLGAQKVEK